MRLANAVPSAALLTILACGAAVAQQANVNLDYAPQRNAENLVPFSAPLNSPDVRDDRTVTFRLKAPEAQSVSLAGVAILTALGQDKPVPFLKGGDGVWSLSVGPLPPDMYVYHLIVDGVQVADPSNTVAGFTAMPPYSQLVVHGTSPAYYDARDVPHGTVTRHVYHSNVTNGERELYVYTPPGYDRAKTYPVLYLVGGSGDLPHNWIYDGRVGFIMDNLLAEGKAVPMVIAIPNNQVVHRNHPRHVELTFDAFERELREHVIPVVEKQYSVRSDPAGRALSGLSMGGRHTMFVGFRSLDLFASFGVLSAGDVESETSIAAFLNDPDVNKKVRYLFVGQGAEEAKGRMGQRCVALHEALLKHGVRHEYYVGGHGGHDWATWRHLVHERFLPGLWRGEAQPSPAPPADSRPARTNVLGAEYPRVTDDSRVIFQLKAPQAKRVQADITGTKYDMARDEDGVWSVTTPPLVPGFHYYQLVVDGTPMNDPASHAYFGVSRDFSGIEVPEKGVDYYLPRDVPHGQVRTVWYHSAVTGDWRRCLVYTPPDYDATPSRRYPVLYLQHGSGEDETGWTEQGHAHFILDNLIAEKKAVPMIVVMDKGYAGRAGQAPPSAAPPTMVNGTVRVGGRPGGTNAFGEVVIKDLVPFVDGTFRTIADRDHRAVAGLSMGGNQACQIALGNLDAFAWLGMFSGTGIGLSAAPFDPKTAFGGAFADAESFNRRVHLVWIGLGAAEPNPFPGSIKAFKESLDKGGIRYVAFESPGTAHEWLTWRRSLNDFAPRLFKWPSPSRRSARARSHGETVKTSSKTLAVAFAAALAAPHAALVVAAEGPTAAALVHTRVKTPAAPGEQAPPADPGQNNFGGPILRPGPGAVRPPGPPRWPEPKFGTVPLDEIAMSDPFVYPDERTHTYYLTGSGGRLYKSPDLKMWTGPYSVIDLKGTWMDGHFVAAPEIHAIGGRYYLAGTWNDHGHLIENVPRRYNVPTNQTQLLVADTPEGPYKPLVPELDFCLGPGDWDIIDGTLYQEDGTTYMVFVHEWTQIIDGTIASMPLAKDLTRRTAEPTTLFRASEAAWAKEMNSIGEATFGLKMPGWVTDGPQLFRTQTGRLGMLWSSWGEHRYAQGVAYSASGTLRGPWVQEKEALKGDNSGHGMLFRTFDGTLLFIVHHAEGNGPRKPEIWRVDDSGDRLLLQSRFDH